MSWECPHQYDDRCDRLGGPCRPTAKGCVLHSQRGLLGADREDEPLDTLRATSESGGPRFSPGQDEAAAACGQPCRRDGR